MQPEPTATDQPAPLVPDPAATNKSAPLVPIPEPATSVKSQKGAKSSGQAKKPQVPLRRSQRIKGNKAK